MELHWEVIPMKEQVVRKLISLTAVISIFALAFGLAGCGKKKAPSGPDMNNVTPTPGANKQPSSPFEPVARGGAWEMPASLRKLVDETKDWSPAFKEYWGKIAPPLTLTDITGNVHDLSKDRGKNVVVMFWRTNNATSKMQASRLKELRSSIPESNLAVLSVSNEPPTALKDAATAQGINFVVLSGGTDLPTPFSLIDALPTTFFIDQKGQFKLAVTGVVSANDARAIIDAK
jgi:peroxiredoxin